MYMHFNSDGSVAGCTLDWGRKVLIGNITKNTAREIWEGDQLNSLQVAHLEGRRCEIDVCDNCNAPMLCAKEDLDPHAQDILKIIRRAPAA
jgi:radical SAM protein with 4Fe4S-binding SPASM domain